MVKKDREPPTFRPKVNEKIICEHKGVNYEAKVLSTRKSPDSQDLQFLVHYQGWSKKWDEWVSDNRILQYNEANVALMKAQKPGKATKDKEFGSVRKKVAIPSNESITSSQEESIIVEPEKDIQLDKEIKIKIPDELKNLLIDDDNNIKSKKLTILPARPTISAILKDFVNSKKMATKASTDKEVILNELTLGLKDYFNIMLGPQLLYKFERLQYQQLLKESGNDVDLTNQYGTIHLIRLFTRIGKPLAAASLDSKNMQIIVNYIEDLLKLIVKQANSFDLDKSYMVAPPDYIKSALK